MRAGKEDKTCLPHNADLERIQQLVVGAGFAEPEIEEVSFR